MPKQIPIFCVVNLFLAVIVLCTIEAKRYLLYDVTHSEGFNLRRDVYVRVANTIRLLQDPSQIPSSHRKFLKDTHHSPSDWVLVLPPWGTVPHWFSKAQIMRHNHPSWKLPELDAIPWSKFFQMESLSKFISIMDLYEFERDVLGLNLTQSHSPQRIDYALKLVRNNLDIQTRMPDHVDFCTEPQRELYRGDLDEESEPFELYSQSLHNYSGNLTRLVASQYDCITGALEPVLLAPFLLNLISNAESNTASSRKDIKIIYLDSAENIINGYWSEWSEQYWTVRRSMVFAKELRDKADEFRQTVLGSTDLDARTIPPLDIAEFNYGSGWMRRTWPLAPAIGGDYLAVHWRRGDLAFQSNSTSTPPASIAANQILGLLAALKTANGMLLEKLFLATDALPEEIQDFKDLLYPLQVIHFYPDEYEWLEIGPGGWAIIDQWICAHAKFFIGSGTSTFTFRITEERSIMGFPPNTTFNTLCPSGTAALVHSPELQQLINPQQHTDDPNCRSLHGWEVQYEPAYSLNSSHLDAIRKEL